jgi:carbamoyl-phosphate synthase large subunit
MKIAVTGLNATDNPGPGVPVIRSLRDVPNFDGKIIGLVYDSLEPGIYKEGLVDRCYQIPFPSSGLDHLFERIKYVNEIEKIDLLIPTLDSELYSFVKMQDKLKAIGIKTFLPTLEQLNIRGKDKLFDFCKENGIKVPKNILVTSINDLQKIPNQLNYPAVIKGIFYEAYVVNNFDEAVTAFGRLSIKWGFPIIVQEYIKGDEFNVVALGDGRGNTIGAVAMKKLYITEKGKGWSGITIDDICILSVSKKVIEKTKWRSGMELEFIKNLKTNEYYLLEINPRFPAWVYLAPAAGQNLPYALVRLANGEEVISFEKYEIGKMFVRCAWDLISDIKFLEQITVKGEC